MPYPQFRKDGTDNRDRYFFKKNAPSLIDMSVKPQMGLGRFFRVL